MTPEVRVKVGGAEIPRDAQLDLLSARVQNDVAHPSSFTLRLNNWDDSRVDMKWSDRDLFKTGSAIEIQMGYRDHLMPLISCEVTGCELSVGVLDPPVFTVRGYDRWHRLMRGKKTTTYTNMKDSDIAGQIASNLGLSAEIEDSGQILDHVLQHNETDSEFLRGRARRIGFEAFVRDGKLIYRKQKHQQPEAAVISREEDGLELHLSLSTMQQVSDVAVRGWDTRGKSAINGAARVADETVMMGGRNVGLQVASDAFGNATADAVAESPSSHLEADQVARAALQRKALSYVTAEGRCIGRTDLLAGVVAQIDGIGKQFSGLYYLESTHHIYSRESGYKTEFLARRSAT
jgi:phage protein D